MKTKFLKSVLPVFAMVLAAGLAFANDSNALNTTGYFDDPSIPGVQQVPGGTDCQMSGVIPCEYDGFQVYADEDLLNPLHKNI
ncbi:DUF6520 family protein [Formosa sp. 3Alg 14/1]|uniref:DUF6520 family protein n=1 Tax=Formosa sp. 3Alg 14/1 TaxID=3382190 RepID=UPI0039BEA299